MESRSTFRNVCLLFLLAHSIGLPEAEGEQIDISDTGNNAGVPDSSNEQEAPEAADVDGNAALQPENGQQQQQQQQDADNERNDINNGEEAQHEGSSQGAAFEFHDENEDTQTEEDYGTEEIVVENSVGSPEAATTTSNKRIEELLEKLKEKKRFRGGTAQAQALVELEGLAAAGSAEALCALGSIWEEGTFVTVNITKAMEYYLAAADKGHSQAQASLGFIYSSGLGVPRDEVKALLYLFFAARGGNTEAQMAMGYRHFFGVGTSKNCQLSAQYYSAVATKVVHHLNRPGNNAVQELPFLSDDMDLSGGAQGGDEDDDVIQYYQLRADAGDIDAQLALGRLYYFGGRNIGQDHDRAFRFFQHAAAQGDPNAQSHLGHMHVHGIGVEQDNDTGINYFKMAAQKNNSNALNGLGYAHMYGYGVPQDEKMAFAYFKQAAELNNPEGRYNLGVLYLKGIGTQANYGLAVQNFMAASAQGNTLAHYSLGVMHLEGTGVEKDCQAAIKKFLKPICERGPWGKMIHNAYQAYGRGEYFTSYRLYLRAAEQGYESGLVSAAWLYDRGPHDIDHFLAYDQTLATNVTVLAHERMNRALRLYLRATDQGNVEAEIRAGDFYYYGYGTSVKHDAAAAHYRQAGMRSQSPQAWYNLGWMFESGLGLARDFHLAKRYYDMAGHNSPDGQIVSVLALARLWLHIKWDALSALRLDALWQQGLGWGFEKGLNSTQLESESESESGSGSGSGSEPKSEPAAEPGGSDGVMSRGGYVWMTQLEWDVLVLTALSLLLGTVLFIRQQRRLAR